MSEIQDEAPATRWRTRVAAELADNLDEELEMELDDERLAQLLVLHGEETSPSSVDRRVYSKELFRLQRELVRLQDWVVDKKLSRSSCCSKAVIQPVRAASSNALPKGSTRASAASSPCLRPPSANAPNGISSATSRTCRRVVRSCCSTAAGTTALASKRLWGFARPTRSRNFSGPCPRLRKRC